MKVTELELILTHSPRKNAPSNLEWNLLGLTILNKAPNCYLSKFKLYQNYIYQNRAKQSFINYAVGLIYLTLTPETTWMMSGNRIRFSVLSRGIKSECPRNI